MDLESTSRIGSFDTTDVTSIGGRWIKWLGRFENYIEAMAIVSATRKKALMLHMAGENLFEIYNPPPIPIENQDNADDERDQEPAAEDEYSIAKRKLVTYFVPKRSLNFEFFNFRQAKQLQNESVDQFYARLLKLSTHCEFTNKDDEIKSQLILTTTSSNLRRYGLREELTLQQLLTYGRSLETTQLQLTAIETTTTNNQTFVNFNKYQRKKSSNNKNNVKSNNNNSNKDKICKNCGNKWHIGGLENCPARNIKCNRCGRHGHFAKVCLSSGNQKNNQQKNQTQDYSNFNKNKNNNSSTGSNNSNNKFNQRNGNRYNNGSHFNNRFAHNVQRQQAANEASTSQLDQQQMYIGNDETLCDDDDQIFNVTSRSHTSNNGNNNRIDGNKNQVIGYGNSDGGHNIGNGHDNRLPKASIEVSGTIINFTIDTGSSVNIISTAVFKQIKTSPRLIRGNDKIFPYNSNSMLPIMGKFTGKLKHNNKALEAVIFVIDSEAPSLLSFKTSMELGLIKLICHMDQNITADFVAAQFPKLLNGVGKLSNHEVHLHTDETVQPTAQKHRRIPFHLRNKVEFEIERLLSEDIIEQAVGPTPWVSPIVVVPKPNNINEIRMCVDMRVANKAIKRERHVTPTVDDIFIMLNGSVMFSKIDLKNGYHQLVLDNESKIITTFSTHCGLYRYKRLSFGVCSAAEIFQNVIRQTLANIPGVINISDDILVAGKTKVEHDKSLIAVLRRLEESNLTINHSKCVYSQSKIMFFGYVFSGEGIHADPRKVAALKSMDPPKDPSEARSLLGMLNYVAKFLPNLASNTKIIRELIVKNAVWKWTKQHQDTFNYLKQQLEDANKLAYFDITQQVHVYVDAGPYGLGAILSQQAKKWQY